MYAQVEIILRTYAQLIGSTIQEVRISILNEIGIKSLNDDDVMRGIYTLIGLKTLVILRGEVIAGVLTVYKRGGQFIVEVRASDDIARNVEMVDTWIKESTDAYNSWRQTRV